MLDYLFFHSGGSLVPLILLSDTYPFLPLVSHFFFSEVGGHLPHFISSSFSFFSELSSFFSNKASGSNK